jgi:hypothetical protein
MVGTTRDSHGRIEQSRPTANLRSASPIAHCTNLSASWRTRRTKHSHGRKEPRYSEPRRCSSCVGHAPRQGKFAVEVNLSSLVSDSALHSDVTQLLVCHRRLNRMHNMSVVVCSPAPS